MEDGSIQHNHPRTVEDIFKDYKARRAGLLKALTSEVEAFYQSCDPDKENLCLYGYPNGTWEVNLPAEEIPPELPEPALGINFARDGMQRQDWLSLVAVHSDAWILSVAYYFGARLDKIERLGIDGVLRRCVSISARMQIITEAHTESFGGHFSSVYEMGIGLYGAIQEGVYNGAKIKLYYSPPNDNGTGEGNTVLDYESETIVPTDGESVALEELVAIANNTSSLSPVSSPLSSSNLSTYTFSNPHYRATSSPAAMVKKEKAAAQEGSSFAKEPTTTKITEAGEPEEPFASIDTGKRSLEGAGEVPGPKRPKLVIKSLEPPKELVPVEKKGKSIDIQDSPTKSPAKSLTSDSSSESEPDRTKSTIMIKRISCRLCKSRWAKASL
ncbi:hypothetical protein L7F22_020059 [Adiantum nelumboides]|nr:hypothetical protein [Adiantum nelumboides]